MCNTENITVCISYVISEVYSSISAIITLISQQHPSNMCKLSCTKLKQPNNIFASIIYDDIFCYSLLRQ